LFCQEKLEQERKKQQEKMKTRLEQEKMEKLQSEVENIKPTEDSNSEPVSYSIVVRE
jgi:hypothetical protein